MLAASNKINKYLRRGCQSGPSLQSPTIPCSGATEQNKKINQTRHAVRCQSLVTERGTRYALPEPCHRTWHAVRAARALSQNVARGTRCQSLVTERGTRYALPEPCHRTWHAVRAARTLSQNEARGTRCQNLVTVVTTCVKQFFFAVEHMLPITNPEFQFNFYLA